MLKVILGPDYNGALQSLITSQFVRVDGCLLERSGTGFTWMGEYFESEQQFRAARKNICSTINSTIYSPNNTKTT